MTFNVCNLGSKYPYFNRAYVVSGGFGWTHLYCGRVTLFILIHPRNHMAPSIKRMMTIARVLDTSKARMHAQDRMLLDTRTDPTPNSLFT